MSDASAPEESNDDAGRRSRRAMMTGGAVLLGGAVLGSQGNAEAADGNSLLVGKSNAAKAMTKLTTSGNNQALNVTNSNTGTQAHGVLSYTQNGYGLLGESTGNSGAVIRTHNKAKSALLAQNLGGTDISQASGITSLTGPGAQQKLTNAGYGRAAVEGAGLNGVIGVSTGAGTGVLGHADGKSGKPSYGVHASGINGAYGLVVSSGRSLISAPDAGAEPVLTVGRGDLNGAGIASYIGEKPSYFYHDTAGDFVGPGGVVGRTTSNGAGVTGFTSNDSGSVGVFASGLNGGTALEASGKTYLGGTVEISGTLSKPGGSFKIDHPQDPAGKYLSHSFVESPDMMNVYNGVATADAAGKATIELPGWFDTLNRDFRYQLTALDAAAPDLHVSKRMNGNQFSIAGAKPGQDLSWMITGIRQDAWANENRIPVEETKPKAERGKYLYPQGFGKPESAGLAAARRSLIEHK